MFLSFYAVCVVLLSVAAGKRLYFKPSVIDDKPEEVSWTRLHDAKLAVTPPTFADVYQVSGVLSLPYAEIEEPFDAWFDTTNKKSRVDYYGGMVITIQRSDQTPYGNSYKIAPMTNEKQTNVKTCFQVNGTANSTISMQSVLPDTTGFTPYKNEFIHGRNCSVWQNITTIGGKTNKYYLWVTDDADQLPVRYEMHGYDTLLGSHYDKYYIEYASYDDTGLINQSVFDVPDGLKCSGFPGPGVETQHIEVNPMREYIHSDDSHTDQQFDDYKNKHNVRYGSEKEHQQRLHTFRNNLRYIHSVNRAGLGYTLAVNHFADRTNEELRRTRGRLTSPHPNGQAFNRKLYDDVDLPENLDWRLYGAVTQVKDQAVCGSCWSFGSTGAIEGALFMKTGQLIRLSQQNIMDCSWGFGNNACDGGEEWRAYEWAMKHGGIMSEDSYGPYLGQDSYCNFDAARVATKVSGYVNVTSGDEKALMIALSKFGPVAVGIDASHKSLSFYSNGVYYEPKCGNTPDDLDHAVLAVGYGILDGDPYWLIKNSWSTYWGNNGYVLMSRLDNNCGVTTDATYVLIK